MAFDGVLRSVTKKLGESAAAEFRQLPYFPKRIVPLFKYPMEAFLDLCTAGAERFARAGVSFDDALRSFGEASVEIFFDNPVGKTMLALNAGNAQRLLAAAAFAYKTVYTFGERTYEKTGEREGVFRYQGDLAGPALQSGVLLAGLRVSIEIVPRFEIRDSDADGTRFSIHLRW